MFNYWDQILFSWRSRFVSTLTKTVLIMYMQYLIIYDYMCMYFINIGVPGTISGIDIDTSFFTGNYSPKASVQAACLNTGKWYYTDMSLLWEKYTRMFVLRLPLVPEMLYFPTPQAERISLIYFQGQRSKVKVIVGKYWNNLVNVLTVINPFNQIF